MLEFFTSFLLLIFSLNVAVNNQPDQQLIFEKLQENLPPISITPPAFYLQEDVLAEENPDSEAQNEEVGNNANPETNQRPKYSFQTL